jgi:programmed cell death protein 4
MQTEPMPKLDLKDPNYNSEDEDDGHDVVFVSEREYQNSPAAIREQNAMSLTDYKKYCSDIITEFFVAKNFEETKQVVKDLGCPSFHFDFVKRLISMSFDQTDKEREAVSQLISLMYRDVLAMGQIGKGFERLLESIDDLVLDVPLARQMLSQFMARALADEVIPPSFVMDPIVQQIGGDVVNHAQR